MTYSIALKKYNKVEAIVKTENPNVDFFDRSILITKKLAELYPNQIESILDTVYENEIRD